MSVPLDREELKASLARVATPKAMVARLWDVASKKFGKSAVKVICVDSERLDMLRFSDAWVGNDDDVKVGETKDFPIRDMGNVTSLPDSKVLVIEDLMQIQCESSDELLSWLTALTVLKKVTEENSMLDEDVDAGDPVEEVKDEEDYDLRGYSDEALLQMQSQIDDIQKKLDVQYAQLEKFEGVESSPEKEAPQSTQKQEFFEKTLKKDDSNEIIEKLTEKVGLLQKLNSEKDLTIESLSKRLEHALQMLRAVHGMYEQQQKVLMAQEAVIEEMDGANDAIQTAASQMKNLIGGGRKLASQSVTPVHRAAQAKDGENPSSATRESASKPVSQPPTPAALRGFTQAKREYEATKAEANENGLGKAAATLDKLSKLMSDARGLDSEAPEKKSTSLPDTTFMPGFKGMNQSGGLQTQSSNIGALAQSTRRPRAAPQQTFAPQSRTSTASAAADLQAQAQAQAQRAATAQAQAQAQRSLDIMNMLASLTKQAGSNIPKPCYSTTAQSQIPQAPSMQSAMQNSGKKPSPQKTQQEDEDTQRVEAMESLEEMANLMKKVEAMKAMLQSSGGLGGIAGGKSEEIYSMAGEVDDGIKASDLPPEGDDSEDDDGKSDHLIDHEELLVSKNLKEVENLKNDLMNQELMNDPKIAGYMQDLSALEEEKAHMQEQLKQAQDQQSQMVNKLAEMKRMMAAFSSLPQVSQ